MANSIVRTLQDAFPDTPPMPVLFVGHGNPMNAITRNKFSEHWRAVGATLPPCKAILCISAHWETRGTQVTAMEYPRTIHDFAGFPQELYEVDYPAPGSPELAAFARLSAPAAGIVLDQRWGLDHGAWSILRHLVPKADVAIVQMSLDVTRTPRQHAELAAGLRSLRTKGVIIVGSGNMVHNLALLEWHAQHGSDWAVAANEKIVSLIRARDVGALADYEQLGAEVVRGIPTPEHYLPLLYAMALQDDRDTIHFFNDELDLGTLSMTSIRIDNNEGEGKPVRPASGLPGRQA